VIDAHFGESAPFSLGVEEELMILDRETYEQVPRVDVLARETSTGQLKTELFASVVELNTPVCETAVAALDALRALRAGAAQAAADHGLVVAAAGSHPLSVPEEQEIADSDHYRRFVDYAGPTARRQGVNGLHVHVGMPSAEACFGVMEALLPWLPVVLAVSANSPYLAGAETGLLSTRAEVLGTLPRSGAPPVFGSYAGWERFVERIRATGLPLTDSYKSFWWDVRPHPRLGTLEIRMPDQPTSVAFTGAFVALLQALCKTLAEGGPPRGPAERGDYQQNRWAAARFGPRAQLIRPDGDRAVPVDALFGELSDLVGPTARELGSADLLVLDPAQCEADRQLEIGRRDGLDALCADLVERSLASA
jgi:glutamate---cysteine ligase / carboxylate-amine ligase